METTLTCPSGEGDDRKIIIDLEQIVKAEARLDEVSFLTLAKAPELLSFYNSQCIEMHKIVGALRSELTKAENRAVRIRANIILDSERRLLERGFKKSSSDLREALVDADEEYYAARDLIGQIQAAHVYMQGKLMGFTNAYNSVKKVLGAKENPTQSFNNPGYYEPKNQTTEPGLRGFGKAKI